MLKKFRIFTGFEFFIARKYLKATSRGRLSFLTAFSVLAIFLGVAALILVIGLMSGFQDEVRQRLLSLKPHVEIQKYPSGPFYDYEKIIRKVESYRDVTSASPYLEAKCIIHKEGNWDALLLRGVQPNNPELRLLSKFIIDGDSSVSGNSILISSYIAQVFGITPGDSVQIYTIVETGAPPPLDFSVEKRWFHVVGVFSTDAGFDVAMRAYADLRTVQDFLQVGDGVSGIEIWLKDPNRAHKFVRKLEDDGVVEFPIYAMDWMSMFKTFFSALNLEKLAMFLVMTLMVIIASFSIIATLSILVLQKTHEIGVLRSLGVTSDGILRIFMLVGTMIGALGAVIGGVTAMFIGFLIQRYHIIHLPPEVYMIDYLPFKLSAGSSIIIMVVTFLIVVLSTLYPAIRASKLPPVEAIRYE